WRVSRGCVRVALMRSSSPRHRAGGPDLSPPALGGGLRSTSRRDLLQKGSPAEGPPEDAHGSAPPPSRLRSSPRETLACPLPAHWPASASASTPRATATASRSCAPTGNRPPSR